MQSGKTSHAGRSNLHLLLLTLMITACGASTGGKTSAGPSIAGSSGAVGSRGESSSAPSTAYTPSTAIAQNSLVVNGQRLGLHATSCSRLAPSYPAEQQYVGSRSLLKQGLLPFLVLEYKADFVDGDDVGTLTYREHPNVPPANVNDPVPAGVQWRAEIVVSWMRGADIDKGYEGQVVFPRGAVRSGIVMRNDGTGDLVLYHPAVTTKPATWSISFDCTDPLNP